MKFSSKHNNNAEFQAWQIWLLLHKAAEVDTSISKHVIFVLE